MVILISSCGGVLPFSTELFYFNTAIARWLLLYIMGIRQHKFASAAGKRSAAPSGRITDALHGIAHYFAACYRRLQRKLMMAGAP